MYNRLLAKSKRSQNKAFGVFPWNIQRQFIIFSYSPLSWISISTCHHSWFSIYIYIYIYVDKWNFKLCLGSVVVEILFTHISCFVRPRSASFFPPDSPRPPYCVLSKLNWYNTSLFLSLSQTIKCTTIYENLLSFVNTTLAIVNLTIPHCISISFLLWQHVIW